MISEDVIEDADKVTAASKAIVDHAKNTCKIELET